MFGAGDRTRTGDSLVGNEGLYQLSYSRPKAQEENIEVRKNSVKVCIGLVIAGCLMLGCTPRSESGAEPQSPIRLQARHLNNLGVVAMDQHNYVRGQQQFEAAIALDPEYAAAHANRGIARYSLGQYDSASVDLGRALQLDADNLHAAYTLGLIRHAQGRDHEAALRLFQRVADHDADDPLVRYYLGRTYAKLGQLDAAMAAYGRVIELDGNNVSAWYALAQAQRQSGDLDAWRTTLSTFNRLSQAGLDGVSSAYQGQGKYAEAVADAPFRVSGSSGSRPPSFEVSAAPAGVTAGTSYLAAADIDGDGQTDLLVQGADGRPRVLHNAGAHLAPSDQWNFDMLPPTGEPEARNLALADVDDDGDVDAALGGADVVIALQDSGRFRPTQSILGGCAAAVFGDADHDGDADIFCADGAPALWYNDGLGAFADATDRAAVHGPEIVQAVFSDLDTDRDVDIVTGGAAGLSLWSNNRDGTFTDVAAARHLTADSVRAIAVADFEADGAMDIAASTPTETRLLINHGTFASETIDLPASAGLVAADLDNDGDVDLIGHGDRGVHVAIFSPAGYALTPIVSTATQRLAVIDADDDGRLDIITPSGLYRNRFAEGGSLRITLAGLSSNADGFGARVEVHTPSSRQVQEYRAGSGPDLHFGIGNERAEFVRVLWPSGVRQTELDSVGSGRLHVAEVNRKGTSCPILYAWNGERFEFVSDFLGGGIIGYLTAPGQYYTPDTDEYLPLRQLVPDADGRLVVQIGNQLEEVIFLDGAELVAVDHPVGTTMFPGERLLSEPPYPTLETYAVSATRPVRVHDQRDNDVSPRLADVDDDWYDDFGHAPVHGYALPYSLRLDLGDLAGWEHPVLLAHGWVDYAHSSSNWAAAQQGLNLNPPRLEARSDHGPWRLIQADMGVPAGLPKHMLVDLADVFEAGAKHPQLRISTNTAVYWDQFLLGRVHTEVPARVHRRNFDVADLHWRGYPAHESIHGTFAYRYNYDDLSTDAGWGTHAGAFTRFGDVDPLLRLVDDQFVVMSHGDELTLSLAAGAFPPLEPGFERTYLFYADGFGKDMDYHSAHSLTVGPMPFHGMSRYPYGSDESYPSTAANIDYVLDYNTRWIKGYYR